MRVLILGGTGTIGRATVAAVLARGHQAVCPVRAGRAASLPPAAQLVVSPATDADSVVRAGFAAGPVDAVICCLASRTGAPADAWAIDHRATVLAINLAQEAGVGPFVLLSAICVQRPRLAFQHAKLAAEAVLQTSGLAWSIVRPTAYFKSLSGQMDRVRRGKPFLVFGNGTLTACTPISDADLGAYLADCLTDGNRHHRILPIGGPGPALTPHDMGQELCRQLGQPVRIRQVPVAMLRGIIAVLAVLGRVSPRMAEKAELARIGHYYATESMLVWDETLGRYSAQSTPQTGSDTLFAFWADVLAGRAQVDRGDHAVF